MKEIWNDIVGYEGIYQVSNFGNVKSLDRIDARGWHRRGEYKRKSKSKTGYLIVGLFKDGIETKHQVHRLVATTFLENHKGYPQVNHKDEDKCNNNVNNLEWCDNDYNMKYTMARHDRFWVHYGPRKRKRKIAQFTIDGTHIKTWKSVIDIQKTIGLRASNIWVACNNKNRHKSQGYIWKFAD